jgi:hypothetical protein
MPISYRVDAVRKVVYTTIEGEITDDEIFRHVGTIGKDPEIGRSFVELVYANPTSVAGVTSSGIKELANAFRGSAPIEKTAFVTSQDVAFGIARMYELLADESPVEIRVFREQAEAKTWLGIE